MDSKNTTRFEAKYAPNEFNGCWEWKQPLDSGYGRFWLNGKTALAHRVSYELYVGEIPEGKQIDHLCRNRSCVKPTHLEPVTIGENVLRGIGISAANARKDSCMKGHPLSGDNLYTRNNGARVCKICQRSRVQKWRSAVSA